MNPGLQAAQGAAAFEGPGSWRAGWRYGAMGMPLAFAALPLYVVWPHHAASQWGLPLALLGAVLLAVRVFDAVTDPLLGRLADHLWTKKHNKKRLYGTSVFISLLLLIGYWGLFVPPVALRASSQALLLWSAAALVLTCTSHSALVVLHQAWGARLGGTATQRSRIAAWREGCGLLGVVTASVLPVLLGVEAMALALAGALVLGLWGWMRAVVPLAPQASLALASPQAPDAVPTKAPLAVVPAESLMAGLVWPLTQPVFRRLLAVFVLNGLSAAVPATLVLFFVQDRLQAGATAAPALLGLYFVAAALSLPLWQRTVQRLGLENAWAVGMVLAVLGFAGVAGLGTGDVTGFALVCVVSGMALGADLVLPGALLAGLVGDLGQRGRREGAFMGWWSVATKLNLALAAGLALPALAWLGYSPGQRGESGLQALTLVYGVLPCVLKLGALGLWWRWFLRPPPSHSHHQPRTN